MMSLGIVILLIMMAVFIGFIMIRRDKITGLMMAMLLILSVSLAYITMGIGQYKSSLEALLASGSTYEVLYYEFPRAGPVLFLLKREGDEFARYYLINMNDADRDETKKKLDKMQKQKLKLGHGKVKMKEGKGEEDNDYGITLDPNEHRPELQRKDE